jgi:hypothetical protein
MTIHEITYDALQKRVAGLRKLISEKTDEIEAASKETGHCTECHWAVRAWHNTEHRRDCWYIAAKKALGEKT